jgi:hypothetical protein
MKTGALGSLVCGSMLCSALAFAGPAGAALTVSGTGDSGGCSLRATIEDVDNGTSGSCGTLEGGTTTIEVPAGHYLLTSGELKVKAGARLKIVGASPADPGETVIDGSEKSRVLEVAAGASATLYGVEVTGGATLHGADSEVPDGDGGPGEGGGGILNLGELVLEHVIVTGNRTGRGGDGGNGAIVNTSARNGGYANQGGNGGGIDNEAGASLSIVASTISDNLTGEGGLGGAGAHGASGLGNIAGGADGGIGGMGGNGGGIFNEGSLTITTSTIAGNATGRGGVGGYGGEGADSTESSGAGTGGFGGRGGNSGLQYSEGGSVVYAEYGGGGGIYNGATLTMTDSTIVDNHTGAGGLGGNAGIGGERTAPFSGRETGGRPGAGGGAGLGGGLLSNETGNSSLTNVTVTGNFTGDGGIGGNGAQSSSRGPGNGGFGGYGGGIWAAGPGRGGLQLTFVTVVDDHLGATGHCGADGEFPTACGPGGPGKGAGLATGPIYGSGTGILLTDSIVADNGGLGDANCEPNSPGEIANGGQDVTYSELNSDTSCPGTVGNPLLGALANNGGPTETMLPGSGSAAIGIATCPVGEDQRGFSRPVSGCDSGAIQAGAGGVGTTATTTSLSSSGSPSTAGAAVTFTATVSPAPGGGTVRFKDGGVVISGCDAKPVITGQASCTETFPIASSHSIVAEYSGTSGFSGSTSGTLTQVVQAESTGGGETGGGGTGGTGSTGGGSGGPGGGGSSGSGSGGGSGGGATVGTPKAGAPKVKGTTVSVSITCAGPTDVTCVVKLILSASGGGSKVSPRLVVARAKPGAKKTTVGVATATIAGGATKTVTVSLDGAGKKALAKAHHLKATLTATQKGGTKPLLVRSVTFKKG